MRQWSEARHRLTHVTITSAAAREAVGAPGGPLVIAAGPHVACGYQIVLPGGRIVHENGLTLHGPATEGALPDDLVAAITVLWRHAEQRVEAQEGLPPA